MNLLQALRGPGTVERSLFPSVEPFGFQGNSYPTFAQGVSYRGETVENSFPGYAAAGYKSNAVIFACMKARKDVFTDVRFQWQRLTNGRPGDLFGTSDLALLETPWPGGTTGDLLARMIQDADLAGNAYVTIRNGQMKRMRPDWVSIVIGSNEDPEVNASDLDAELLGYIYMPGGVGSGRDPIALLPGDVAHFAPEPDPDAWYRGMSWLTPVVRELEADTAATAHKLAYFRNGTSPKLVFTFENAGAAEVRTLAQEMNALHAGTDNAYKNIYMGGGADVTVAGADLRQLDFKATQGAGETRIAAAAGVHPVVVGLSEGLAGSSLNAGNFNSARRLVADKTLRTLWRNVAGSLDVIVPQPPVQFGPARLWYDTRDVAFLREDIRERADVQFIKAQTIKQLVEAGYTPESVWKAVEAEDMTLLVHTGLTSVQLLKPGEPSGSPAGLPAPSVNGNAPSGVN